MGFVAPVMAVMGAAGAAVNAIGALNAGEAKSAQAMYQSQVAENNALLARQNVQWTEAAGASQLSAQGMKTRQAVGQAVATQGASGVDSRTGSNADVQTAEKELGLLDALTIRSNTARKAYGYEVEESNQKASAANLRTEAENARTGGILSALGTFLSGASSVGGKFSNWSLGAGGGSGVNYDPSVSSGALY